MIAWLKGRLRHREVGWGILDVGGVGYELFAPARALDAWSTADEEVEVFVATQVREDAITLFGFSTVTDRRAFQVLISVSGIGPKLALSCLDALPLDALVRAVETNDVAALSKVPGVGRKTAQRIALDLKGKLPAGAVPITVAPPSRGPASGPDTLELALQRLGYNRPEIQRVLDQLPEHGLDRTAPVADRLKAALRILYGGP